MTLTAATSPAATPRSPLPRMITAYLDRALPDGVAAPASAMIEQRGTMWRTPGGRGLQFTAQQQFDATRTEFAWRARFVLFPGLWLHVEDALLDGHGRLEARLWDRLRVMHESGPEIDRGQILRYLAELPWNPYAMLRNPALVWRDAGREVEVALAGSEPRAAVTFTFDGDGDIRSVTTAARERVDGRVRSLRPWGGSFAQYELFDRVRMPRRAEVWWDLPGGRFVYWRGELCGAAHAW